MDKKVLVGVTASYDSFATLILLKLQNFEINALHVVMGDKNDDSTVDSQNIKCHGQTNQDLLQEICSVLNVPLYFVDQKDTFNEQIVNQNILASFMKEYQFSCIQCHKIKVSTLYQKMLQLGCDFMATGHYAKLRKAGREGLVSLYQYNDISLDQHKLLSAIDQSILSKLLLPLGDLSRDKVIAILKEHLPKNFNKLSSGGNKKACNILVDPVLLMKKTIAPGLNRKSRLCMREKNTFLNEAYDNTEFEFGKTFKLGSDHRGKEQLLTVTGYNFSYQTIYVSEEESKGVNYFFVQILEYFGEPNLFTPTINKVTINDEDEMFDATVYYKGLNYAIVFFNNNATHKFVPAKSLLSILEDTRIGRKCNFLTRIISQGFVDNKQNIAPFILSKIEDDFPH